MHQAPFHAVIGLYPLQDLELGLDLTSGAPLRRAKARNQFSRKREVVGIEQQALGDDFLAMIALDQQLGR